MSLVERGAVDLDAPLGKYLKEFRGKQLDESHDPAASDPQRRALRVPAERHRRRRASRGRHTRSPGSRSTTRRAPASSTATPGSSSSASSSDGSRASRSTAIWTGSLFRPLGLPDTSFQPRRAAMARVAPTEFAQRSHFARGGPRPPGAPLGGVAGHAGMFSTAADLARICRMLLKGGTLDGQRILSAATVRTMWEAVPDSRARTLGWDVASSYSRTIAPFFPGRLRRPPRVHGDCPLDRSRRRGATSSSSRTASTPTAEARRRSAN